MAVGIWRKTKVFFVSPLQASDFLFVSMSSTKSKKVFLLMLLLLVVVVVV